MSSKVMIVTGGGRGIGAATALLAAERGYAVCVNYQRDRDSASAVVQSIQSKGGKALAVQADVSSEPDVLKLFDATERELGKLGALVNNAGIVDQKSRVDQSLSRCSSVTRRACPIFPQLAQCSMVSLVRRLMSCSGALQSCCHVFGSGYARKRCTTSCQPAGNTAAFSAKARLQALQP